MYLAELSISNFRRLKNITIKFQHGLNVIVGPNNIGKTAVIDALRALLAGADDPYSPPPNTFNFALVHLTFLDNHPSDEAAHLLESEAATWLGRFPTIPIMASAFDVTDSLIDLKAAKPDSFVYAWTDNNRMEMSWDQQTFSDYTNTNPLDFDLRTIFPAVGCQTDAEVKREANLHFAKIRTGNRILRWGFWVWVAAIPATWAVIEFLGPEWLGAAVLAYSLWKAFKEGQKVLGYHKPSQAEKEKDEKDRKKDHYFYHCERNPKGFARLMCENLEEDAKQRVIQEAKDLGEQLGSVPRSGLS